MVKILLFYHCEFWFAQICILTNLFGSKAFVLFSVNFKWNKNSQGLSGPNLLAQTFFYRGEHQPQSLTHGPRPRWTATRAQGPPGRFDSGQARAHVILDVSRTAGGRIRGGAAVLWHAGAHRLLLRELHDAGHLVDKVSLRGAPGNHAGDEARRR